MDTETDAGGLVYRWPLTRCFWRRSSFRSPLAWASSEAATSQHAEHSTR